MGTTAIAVSVTPTLFVGGSPTFACTRCTTATEAEEIIRSGGTVVLPEGAWSTAADTLRLLGSDEAWAERQIHYAQTGEIL